MNFYAFHIGDYASATRHLTWEEDCAYRRLLDVYYTREEPLPNDIRAICRLVVATTPEQREAVEVVLGEFFQQSNEGWISPRADREIDAMRIKQSAQDEKAQHESERMRRHRERRAGMFEALRVKGIVPAWDVPLKELQRLVNLHCNAPASKPETHLQREQVVSGDEPATAISTNPITNPITTINTPLTPQGEAGGEQPGAIDLPEPHELPRQTGDNSNELAGAVCLMVKRIGIGLVNPSNPKLNALLNAGVSVGQFEAAARKALAANKTFSYALAIVEREEKEARELANALLKPKVAGTPAQAAKSFAQQEREEKARRWEEMTGERHPDALGGGHGFEHNVIDITPAAPQFTRIGAAQ